MQKLTDNIYALVIMAMLGTFILASSFVALLLHNQKKLLQQKEKLQAAEIEHQKQLLRTVIESQESERRRIGQDLHDDVGTALSNLRITGERYAREVSDNESLNRLIATNRKMIDQVMVNVRNISHNLSPEILTIHTLSEAIEELCHTVRHAASLDVSLTNSASETLDAADLTTALVIYRVLEELITNTVRHAAAGSIYIVLEKGQDRLLIDYRDNGKGIPAASEIKKGRGLQNIESRLSIIQAVFVPGTPEGGGYQMQIKIPVTTQ